MKTKLCRPILLPTKDIQSSIIIKGVMPNLCRLISDVIDDDEWIRFGKPQQLILISLDPDENLELNEKVYIELGEFSRITRITNLDNGHPVFSISIEEGQAKRESLKRIIANQSQLSHEYTQQFIEEYNRGEVKDVEIEMEEIGNWRHGEFVHTKDIPKLTNGFITIVKKEPILYTEKEVKALLAALKNEYSLVLAENGFVEAVNNTEFNLKEWFEQNKKK